MNKRAAKETKTVAKFVNYMKKKEREKEMVEKGGDNQLMAVFKGVPILHSSTDAKTVSVKG